MAGEQLSVHVRETGQILVERPLPPADWRVQDLEELHEPRAEVRAVWSRPFLDELEEDVARLEDPGVVGEQAEDGPYQEQLEVVTPVAGRLQCIVQSRDQLGRVDVDRILVAERPALHADDGTRTSRRAAAGR